jgi:hypothetical protein
MNAPRIPAEIPACLAKREEDAIYAWFSTRRLLVIKDGQQLTLSADDLRGLLRFVDANKIGEQLQ